MGFLHHFLSPFDKYHNHVFVAQVKVKDIKRLKYLEIFYNPITKKRPVIFLDRIG